MRIETVPEPVRHTCSRDISILQLVFSIRIESYGSSVRNLQYGPRPRLVEIFINSTGFSISFGVDGLNIKVRVLNKFRSRRLKHKSRRREKRVPLARASRGVCGYAPPEKSQNLEGHICCFMRLGKQFCNKKLIFNKRIDHKFY